MALRVALFVEGSQLPPPQPGRPDPFTRTWEQLAQAAGRAPFSAVVPITKKHLLAMSPRRPAKMSGAAEGLDQLMVRTQRTRPFDAAVVIWDLVPDWHSRGEYCRWQETLDLYAQIAGSTCLDEEWRSYARKRHAELVERPLPRPCPPGRGLQRGEVLGICLDPMYEGLLCQDEGAFRRALGHSGARPRGWPGSELWGLGACRRPDAEVVSPALRALQGLPAKQRPELCRRVPPDFTVYKVQWGELLLRNMLERPEDRPLIVEHPLTRRLRDRLPEQAGEGPEKSGAISPSKGRRRGQGGSAPP